MKPATINCYTHVRDIIPCVEKRFDCVSVFHLGMYDYLTRVYYPLIVGESQVEHNTVFSEEALRLSKVCNPDSLGHLSRIRGYVFQRRAG
ncbi:hypothetical protein HWQ67_19645 [Candidatus Magnetobacterium casensis]|uniref:Uncharacterized protein n=1 Tax=Candidatus Magnetobacterium casense TaxID=1455061 RepID=A0ABS6S4L2_9BACT|nr:hypothetical protein [Candidatus Magnetobacterium casensis]